MVSFILSQHASSNAQMPITYAPLFESPIFGKIYYLLPPSYVGLGSLTSSLEGAALVDRGMVESLCAEYGGGFP